MSALNCTILSTAQTGNGASTNVAGDQAAMGVLASGGIVITTTVGATPTVTVDIQGSCDGTNYYNIPYALVATPTTFVMTAITITTATTTTYMLQPNIPYQFVRLVYSANTNVTISAKAYI